jgi:hypothetical protein
MNKSIFFKAIRKKFRAPSSNKFSSFLRIGKNTKVKTYEETERKKIESIIRETINIEKARTMKRVRGKK